MTFLRACSFSEGRDGVLQVEEHVVGRARGGLVDELGVGARHGELAALEPGADAGGGGCGSCAISSVGGDGGRPGAL